MRKLILLKYNVRCMISLAKFNKVLRPKSASLDFYPGLHDYFRNYDVRNAHVLSINNVGDFAFSSLKVG